MPDYFSTYIILSPQLSLENYFQTTAIIHFRTLCLISLFAILFLKFTAFWKVLISPITADEYEVSSALDFATVSLFICFILRKQFMDDSLVVYLSLYVLCILVNIAKIRHVIYHKSLQKELL